MLSAVFGLSVATCVLGLFAMIALQKEHSTGLSLVLGVIFWFAWASSLFAVLAQLP